MRVMNNEKNGLFGSKYKMSMMVVSTSMRKFVSDHTKIGIAR